MRGRACCVGIGMCRAAREHRPSTSGGGLSRGSRDDHIMITPAEKISGDEVNVPICRSCVVCFVDDSCSDRSFIVLGASLSAITPPKKKSCQSQPTGIYKCKIAISSRDDIYLSISGCTYPRCRGIVSRCPLNNTERNVTVPAEISWVLWILHPVILSA